MNTTIPLNGMELVRQTDQPQIRRLADVYDQHAKLVFLFDVSGSMDTPIARGYENQYLWPEEKLEEIRQACHAALKRERDMADGVAEFRTSSEDRALLGAFDPVAGGLLPDEELKQLVIRADLIGHFNLQVDWVHHTEKPMTRLEAVKRVARQEIGRRLDKYPSSQIAVIEFGTQPHVLYNEGATRAQLLAAIDQLILSGLGSLCGHSTDILSALAEGMNCCRQLPGSVGVHHFILVSDGEDWNAERNIEGWVDTFKTSGIVLDYIHIGDRHANRSICAAARTTGGDYVNVASEKELEAKFVEAVSRKCLPPAQ